MKRSLTYYIILMVLSMKGIKKDFSKDPIDYEKIRKDDIKQPKDRFFRSFPTSQFTILDSKITEINQEKKTESLVIFIHGGAFISGPSKTHWVASKSIVKRTKHTLWMCDYPKAPENNISKTLENINAVYQKALEKYAAESIYLIGDSAGATLILSLVQRLIQAEKPTPHKLILLSPVMDASLENSKIDEVDDRDPILSKTGLLSALKMCNDTDDLKNPMLSPLYGSFEDFPSTLLLVAENDITYPDQILAIEKFKESKIDLEVVYGVDMPHIWPYLPRMKESIAAFDRIISSLSSD